MSKEDNRTYSQVTRICTEDSSSQKSLTNGRRKNMDKTELSPSVTTTNAVPLKKKVMERFEKSESATKCVSAFKESDSWD